MVYTVMSYIALRRQVRMAAVRRTVLSVTFTILTSTLYFVLRVPAIWRQVKHFLKERCSVIRRI